MNTMHSTEESFTSDLARSLNNATIDFAVAQELQTVNDIELVFEDVIGNFYGSNHPPVIYSDFNTLNCDDYYHRNEAYNMQQSLTCDELEGGYTTQPSFPSLVSLDLISCLNLLATYTNNLEQLKAPGELCVQKAIELISIRSCYEINLEVFRLEMISDNVDENGIRDVDALVKGIDCIAQFLLAYFDNSAQLNADVFPYEFYCLHNDRYLFLSKIAINAKLSIPPIVPTAVARPAYTYPDVQERTRKVDFTETYLCPVI